MEGKIKSTLFDNVRTLIVQTQQTIVRNVNQAMVFACFRIGKMIVEDEQNGQDRADYASETLPRLSKALTEAFGKGYSWSNLEYMRNFYLRYQDRISQTLYGKSEISFQLSWSHYVTLIKMKDDDERSFYEIEAAANNWSVREMQRQYNSALYERLALSKDK